MAQKKRVKITVPFNHEESTLVQSFFSSQANSGKSSFCSSLFFDLVSLESDKKALLKTPLVLRGEETPILISLRFDLQDEDHVQAYRYFLGLRKNYRSHLQAIIRKHVLAFCGKCSAEKVATPKPAPSPQGQGPSRQPAAKPVPRPAPEPKAASQKGPVLKKVMEPLSGPLVSVESSLRFVESGAKRNLPSEVDAILSLAQELEQLRREGTATRGLTEIRREVVTHREWFDAVSGLRQIWNSIFPELLVEKPSTKEQATPKSEPEPEPEVEGARAVMVPLAPGEKRGLVFDRPDKMFKE